MPRPYSWQEQLESGQFADITQLANELGLDRRYASRILGLTSLTPDIVQAILDGDEPEGLSLAKLRDGVPEGWKEQRGMWSHS